MMLNLGGIKYFLVLAEELVISAVSLSDKELFLVRNWGKAVTEREFLKKKFTQSDMEENVLHNNVMKFKL